MFVTLYSTLFKNRFFLASMQRLIYLQNRAVLVNHHPSIVSNGKLLILKRCLSNIVNNKNEYDLDGTTKLYKPSTTKQETHVPDELKGGQSVETFDTTPKSAPTLAIGEKVWSVQDPSSIHVAPLAAISTKFVPTPLADGQTVHETTVYKTQGQLNFADPLKTHTLQHEHTPGQSAEAAAASAFELFPPDTHFITDSMFAQKISSTDLYSSTSSENSEFQNFPPSEKKSSNTNKTADSSEIPIQRESDLRNEILRESLKYVGEKGWTMEAIRAGVRASNQPTTMEGLFSNGYDLVEYFMRDANAKMTVYMHEKLKKGDLQGTRLLIHGLKYRLGLVIPYAKTWDQALAQGALPPNALRGWKNLLDLSNDAWHGIGDTSTDINWYSKRLLLAAVYKSAEVYMLQDQSSEKIDTMNFLERRLNDFQAFGSVRNTVSKSLSDTAQIASGLFSVVRNLTSRR